MPDLGYVDLGFTADANPDRLRQRGLDELAAGVGGYTPVAGNPEYRVLDATAEMAADREAVAVDVSRAVFRQIARTMYRIVPVEASKATGTTSWVFADTAGHTIPAGTQVSIGGVLFLTTTQTVIGSGETTATGVAIVAAFAGADASNLSGSVKLQDALTGSPTITVEGVTVGGRDAEPQDEFEERASATIATWGRPVLPVDVERIALEEDGVGRALAIDNYKPGPPYDPDPASDSEERTLTVAVASDQGLAVSSGTRAAVDARLQSERETTFRFWVIDPTYTTILYQAEITVYDGYDTTATLAAAKQAADAYLDPALYGMPTTGNRPNWHDEPVVMPSELFTVLNNVEGVRHVTSLKLAAGRPVTASAATDQISLTAHGILGNEQVLFSGLVGGAPLTDLTAYYRRDSATDWFKVATTPGGPVIDITSDMTAGMMFCPREEDVTLAGPAPLPLVHPASTVTEA